MEAISLKLDGNMLRNIDQALNRHNYSTRTELIRDAIRDKLEELNRDILIAEFMKYKGKSKIKTTREENRLDAEKALLEIAKERGWEI